MFDFVPVIIIQIRHEDRQGCRDGLLNLGFFESRDFAICSSGDQAFLHINPNQDQLLITGILNGPVELLKIFILLAKQKNPLLLIASFSTSILDIPGFNSHVKKEVVIDSPDGIYTNLLKRVYEYLASRRPTHNID